MNITVNCGYLLLFLYESHFLTKSFVVPLKNYVMNIQCDLHICCVFVFAHSELYSILDSFPYIKFKTTISSWKLSKPKATEMLITWIFIIDILSDKFKDALTHPRELNFFQ